MAKAVDYVTLEDGTLGYVLEDGTILPSGQMMNQSPGPSTPSPEGVAGNVAGLYGANKIGGLVSGSGASTGISSGASSVATPEILSASRLPTTIAGNAVGMGALPLAGIAIGTYLGGKGIYDTIKGKEDNSLEGKASRLQAGISTGGLSEIGRLVGLGHKSTKDYQKERWGALSPEAQGLYQANHPENDDGTWKDGKYAGQKWSFDKALDLAKEDPTHFIGVLGNVEAFGNDWLGVDLDTQKKVVSELINQGLYTSDKGDVLLKDKNKAKGIFESVVGRPIAQQNSSGAETATGKGGQQVSVDTIFKNQSSNAKTMPGQLINPQTLMKSNSQSQAGKFNIPRASDIINQNMELSDQALSPVADMETRMMQNPLITNPLFSLVRRT